MPIVKTFGVIDKRKEISKILEELCIKDNKNIDDETHGILMEGHFYYVDHQEQGWYVSDEEKEFQRVLTDEEFVLYSEMYDHAAAYF